MKNIKTFESYHNDNIDINVYSGKEFYNIYNNLDINNIDYHHPRSDFQELENVYFFTIKLDEEIIGLAHIRRSPYIENTFWLSYLSIKDKYQGEGYASKLANYIFKWYKEMGLQFETSSYSKKGLPKLKPLFNKLAKKYNVDFIDKETII